MYHNLKKPDDFFGGNQDETNSDEKNESGVVPPETNSQEEQKEIAPEQNSFVVIKTRKARRTKIIEQEQEQEDFLSFVKQDFVKSPYIPRENFTFSFDFSTKRSKNIGNIMEGIRANKNVLSQTELERKAKKEREAIIKEDEIREYAGDLGLDKVNSKIIDGEKTERENNKKIDGFLLVLSSVVATNKKNNKTLGSISSELFFQNVCSLVEYMNDEERGRFLILCIFGTLISRAKFLGAGSKPGFDKFPLLCDRLSLLVKGRSFSFSNKAYIELSNKCVSGNLNSYRSETSTGIQVDNVIALINRMIEKKYPVFFPPYLIYQDPIEVYKTVDGAKILDTKTVSLQGTPTNQNLLDFFRQPQVKPTGKSKQKSNSLFDGDDYYSQPGDDIQAAFDRR